MICSLSSRRIVAISIVVAAIGLSSCAQSPERSYAKPISTTASREKLALDLQDRGELAEALVQWKILSTIEPANGYYEKQTTVTKQVIDKKSKSLMSDGVVNLRHGAHGAARLSFLKALALNPKNTKALEYLRQLTMLSPNTEQDSSQDEGTCCKSQGAM
ncbi:MAG: hypothetical protein ACREUR_05615 [Nitrosospira sp.]